VVSTLASAAVSPARAVLLNAVMVADARALILPVPKAATWAEVRAANCEVVSRLTAAVVRAAIEFVGKAAICAGVRLVMDAMGR
jgi:hypothetical protein